MQQRLPVLPRGAIVCQDHHFLEEAIERGAQPRDSPERPAVVLARQKGVDGLSGFREVPVQRPLGVLLEELVPDPMACGWSRGRLEDVLDPLVSPDQRRELVPRPDRLERLHPKSGVERVVE